MAIDKSSMKCNSPRRQVSGGKKFVVKACKGGKENILFPGDEERTFLEDGDEVVMRAWGDGDGKARIGFGECRSVIVPAA